MCWFLWLRCQWEEGSSLSFLGGRWSQPQISAFLSPRVCSLKPKLPRSLPEAQHADCWTSQGWLLPSRGDPAEGRRVVLAIVSSTAWRQMWEDSHPRTEEPHALRPCLDLLLERKDTMVITVTYPRAQDSFRGALHLDLGLPNSLPLLFHLCLSWFGSSWLKKSIWLMRLVYQAQLGLWIASRSLSYPPVNRWLLLGVTPFCWHTRITSHLESVLVAGS